MNIEHESEFGQCFCIGCKKIAPEAPEVTTLSKDGWRLKIRFAMGIKVAEWRCPKCWDVYKKMSQTM